MTLRSACFSGSHSVAEQTSPGRPCCTSPTALATLAGRRIATEGAVAAVIAIAAGENAARERRRALLAVIVLADRAHWPMRTRPRLPRAGRLNSGVQIIVACLAAAASESAFTPRVALGSRQFGWDSPHLRASSGSICVALPLAVRRRIRITGIGTGRCWFRRVAKLAASSSTRRSSASLAGGRRCARRSLFAAFAVEGQRSVRASGWTGGQWPASPRSLSAPLCSALIHH